MHSCEYSHLYEALVSSSSSLALPWRYQSAQCLSLPCKQHYIRLGHSVGAVRSLQHSSPYHRRASSACTPGNSVPLSRTHPVRRVAVVTNSEQIKRGYIGRGANLLHRKLSIMVVSTHNTFLLKRVGNLAPGSSALHSHMLLLPVTQLQLQGSDICTSRCSCFIRPFSAIVIRICIYKSDHKSPHTPYTIDYEKPLNLHSTALSLGHVT